MADKNMVTIYDDKKNGTVQIAEDVLEGTASSSLTPAQLMALFR